MSFAIAFGTRQDEHINVFICIHTGNKTYVCMREKEGEF